MGIFSIFGSGEIKKALKKGAVVIDVRTAQEFDMGKVPGSINIPMDRIISNIQRIKGLNKPIIFCSASGIRSKTAKSIMQKQGIKNVYAAGSWEKVLKIMNKL